MSKKFTEEQYQQIVEAWDNDGDYNDALSLVIEVVDDFEDGYSYNEALTLANPKSREWAHEQFVEKEKKYMWRLKDNNYYRLTNHGGATQVNISHSTEDELTESEIKAWGYNPEMFDKEEVD